MCTLTYNPIGGGRFLIGSNRDESTKRAPASLPQIIEKDGQRLLYPMDPEAKGSWIASSETGRCSCLLNGAFEPHKHKPPYRKSRGLVLLDSFAFPNLQLLADEYDLDGIEPFTLVSFESLPELTVSELRWDGSRSHLKQLDAKNPTIWCSALLYSKEEQSARQGWFDTWRAENPDPNILKVQRFHSEAGKGKILAEITTPQGFLIKTVSITTLEVYPDYTDMMYEDLQKNISKGLRLGRL